MKNKYRKHCIKLIEEKLNWGPSKDWKQRQFNTLSDKINQSSGILISPHTLKRFFGKLSTPDDYLPQENTLNAFANYLGYKNWNIFTEYIDKIEDNKIIDNNNKPHTKDKIEKEAKIPLKNIKKITVIVLIIGGLFFITNWAISLLFPPKGKLEIRLQEKEAPQTVIFKYSHKNIRNPKSFYIDLDNDAKGINLKQLDKNNNTITTYYPYPGLFNIKLIYNDKILDSKEILLETKNWGISVYPGPTKNRYIIFDNNSRGVLTLNNNELYQREHDTSRFYQTEFYIYRDFKVSADSLYLETSLKNFRVTSDKAYCNYVRIIINDRNKFHLNITDEKCFNNAFLKTSDYIYEGTSMDLSSLGIDMDTWTDISISISNFKINIYSADKKLLTVPYNEPIGKLRGIKFLFNTMGAVDYMRLYNNENKIIYKEDFIK